MTGGQWVSSAELTQKRLWIVEKIAGERDMLQLRPFDPTGCAVVEAIERGAREKPSGSASGWR